MNIYIQTHQAFACRTRNYKRKIFGHFFGLVWCGSHSPILFADLFSIILFIHFKSIYHCFWWCFPFLPLSHINFILIYVHQFRETFSAFYIFRCRCFFFVSNSADIRCHSAWIRQVLFVLNLDIYYYCFCFRKMWHFFKLKSIACRANEWLYNFNSSRSIIKCIYRNKKNVKTMFFIAVRDMHYIYM